METVEKDTTYNGWKNYETWSVALIVDNDQGLYNERRAIVRDAIENHKESEYWTEEEATRYGVADAIKEWIEGAAETDVVPDFPLSYLWSQLLAAALSEVDWHEIADNWIEDESESDEG
jgi:hypothetical protein